MRRLHIDFAPRSIRRRTAATPVISWIALAIAIALWAGILSRLEILLSQKSMLEERFESARQQEQARLSKRKAQTAENGVAIPDVEIKAANEAIAQLNLPWRDLFDALESATPPTIALLAIEPDAKRRLIKGTAEARGGDELVTYIEKLKKEPLFSSVLLLRHEVNDRDVNRPIRFQFIAAWSDATP